MRYFIGYLIQGEAAEWHRNCAKEISKKFNTEKIYERIPPHITLVPPFDAEDIFSVKDTVHAWTARSVPGDFVLSGFDRFGDEVIFASVDTSAAVAEAVSDLQKQVQMMPDIPSPGYREWRPHATLANHFKPFEVSAIWEYVCVLPKPQFVLPFDNVTLFRRDEGGTWRVDEIFYLNT